MFKHLVLAATVAATLSAGSPVAHAAVVRSGCGSASFAQETVTGQDTYTGVAYGYAVFDDQGSHTLRCYITVDGVEQSSTPTQSGSATVATAGQVTYSAAEGATVDLCTEIDGVTVSCGPAMQYQSAPCADDQPEGWPSNCPPYIFPLPPPLGDLIDSIVCPILASLSPGIPGVVDISPEGDVTLPVLGPFWDGPPYGNL
jgi:hypothetical protein